MFEGEGQKKFKWIVTVILVLAVVLLVFALLRPSSKKTTHAPMPAATEQTASSNHLSNSGSQNYSAPSPTEAADVNHGSQSTEQRPTPAPAVIKATADAWLIKVKANIDDYVGQTLEYYGTDESGQSTMVALSNGDLKVFLNHRLVTNDGNEPVVGSKGVLKKVGDKYVLN